MINRTLTAAMSMIKTVAMVAEMASFDNHQVLAQVASISTTQTTLAGLLNRKVTRYLIKYSSGNRMIQSRSTMCQYEAPLSSPVQFALP